MNTDSIGDRSTGRILAALLETHKNVLVPFGVARYDLVVETNDGKLKRVQCKTGRLRNGAVVFNAYSLTGRQNVGFSEKRYNGEADLFGVFCPQTEEVYLIPVEDIIASRGYLRYENAKNNQSSGIKLASDYKIFPCPVV